eukprot:jgi/Phyca11/124799/e_gw1.55.277.1
MPTPQMSVSYSGGYFVNYTAPGVFKCMSFSTCPHWNTATSITWGDLPKGQFAMFYETETCRTGGKFFYISDIGESVGAHTFEKPQAIRSFMFGKDHDYMRRPTFINTKCTDNTKG